MAAHIPEQKIQDIIAANDIVSFVGQYVTLKRSGNAYVGLCPFHKEKTPSFHVSSDRQLYHCFGCNAGGNIIDFVKNIENIDFLESVRLLAERAGIPIDNTAFREEDKKLFEQKKLFLEINKKAARFFYDSLYTDAGKTAREYVLKRKLSPETLKTYGIGYAPDSWDALTAHLLSQGYSKEQLVGVGVSSFTKTGKLIDRFRARLMFPIFDIRGNLIGFGGRRLDDEKPKYLNSAETILFNKGKNLFSLQFAKKFDSLIIVEGYMDVISLYQNGVQNAVASLGTALTREQARLAANCAERIVLCYDTDSAGIKAAQRAIEVFEGMDVKLRILSLPEGKDPDEYVKIYGAVKFNALLQKAETPAGFQMMLLRKKYDLLDTYQKMEYAEACAKIISTVPSSVEREVLREKVAAETGIGSSAIAREVEKKHVRAEKAQKWNVHRKNNTPLPAPKQKAAEKLVSLCLKDKSVYQKYKDMLLDIIEDAVLIKVLNRLAETDDAALIVSGFSEEETAKAAAALCMPLNFENNLVAAKELIAALQKETYDRKVQEAAKSGDLETLNTLLMKNKKEGGD